MQGKKEAAKKATGLQQRKKGGLGQRAPENTSLAKERKLLEKEVSKTTCSKRAQEEMGLEKDRKSKKD